MKRKLLVAVAGISISIISSISAGAQIDFSYESPQKKFPLDLRSNSDNISSPTYYNNISTRAIRHFVNNFAEVSNEKWFCTAQLFVAMFTLNDIEYRIDYDKKGNWIETFKTYSETQLEDDIRESVKSSYYDYNIVQVQEIQQPSRPKAYIVHLEGKTRLINLQVCNGVMQEWQNFIKSK